MSDCSTNAMRPKEPPKICGNCAHFVRAEGYIDLGICSEIYIENDACDDGFAAVKDYRRCDNLSLFKYKQTDTLEQRYQQLEQVAKEMLAAMDAIVCTTPHLSVDGVLVFRKQLEALGVSLDG